MSRVRKVKQLPVDEVRNLVTLGDGRCNCEVNHSTLGWIPFTYDPADEEEYSVIVKNYINLNKVDISALPMCDSVARIAAVRGRDWRDAELSRADMIINKIEDFEIDGDSKVWRKYRVALRNWPETENFPEVTPDAPDAK